MDVFHQFLFVLYFCVFEITGKYFNCLIMICNDVIVIIFNAKPETFNQIIHRVTVN